MAKILIVEDDELNLRMYQKIFTTEGHDVEVAMDGNEGLEKIKTVKPSLILLDIMMPKLNGIDMLRKLKALPEIAKIPVVILTNLTGRTEAESALTAGAVKYIIKSDYKPQEIADIVGEILAGYTRDAVPNAAAV